MDARHSFVAALRTQLEEKPYNKITVQNLCDSADLSRRTFYKHFVDKDDVVRAMIQEDFVDPALSMRSIMVLEEIKSSALLLTESMYKQIYDQRDTYRNLLAHMGKLELLEMILDENYLLSKGIFANYDYDEIDMDYAAFVMGSATATTVIRWIENDFDIPCSKMAQLYGTWVNAHWRELGFPQK